MWKSMFLAMGIFSFILGVECLLIDEAELNKAPGEDKAAITERFAPPEWAPWSLMSGGAVVVLYSFTLPQKLKGAG